MPVGSDPLPLAAALLRCPSVTPDDAGAIDVLIAALEPLGFVCHDLTFATGGPPIRNLYARLGGEGPNLCFAGHTDVVPAGQGWSADPFAAEIRDGRLFGRGATDMKGAIACFVAAVARFLARGRPRGSISLLITGDEEGPAVDGTVKVLDWLAARGERLDACIVGEPTNPGRIGEMMKIGRRGSLNTRLTVHGTQGHAAYPHLADNPIPRLMAILGRLSAAPLDAGNAHFQASTLTITTIDVGNPATNVIPAQARAGFNIRFNDLHTGASLKAWIEAVVAERGGRTDVAFELSGESFLTAPGPLSQAVATAAQAVTGLVPEASTTGGTSDARFIRHACPVVEFGLATGTMHKADENVAVADLETLTAVYGAALERLVGWA
ncbi:MAG: succinyl-diaminopimelate desuccinylase [Magnetospirillum sp.]|nr:succinyl-diaminopimelate desuccinylase [Magnetospirillum sp.]